MSDAQSYLRRARQLQTQMFGRAGVARDATLSSEQSTSPAAPAAMKEESGVVIVPVEGGQRDTQMLPMKKKKKRSRSDSDSDDGHVVVKAAATSSTGEKAGGATVSAAHHQPPQQQQQREATHDDTASLPTAEEGETLQFANVASPSSPTPAVEGVAQRIGLLAKWFPSALQEGKLDAAMAPGVDFVEGTVERLNKARDYVLALRYGIEDVETLLQQTRDVFSTAWEKAEGEGDGASSGGGGAPATDRRERFFWQLRGRQLTKLVRLSGSAAYKEALAEFVDEVPATSTAVAATVRALALRRRRLRVPLEYSLKGWHDVLDVQGPTSGYAPQLSDILWLSVASATAMFTVMTQRLLHRARALAEKCFDGSGDSKRESSGPRFYDNTMEEAEDGSDSDAPEVDEADWIASESSSFDPTLSSEQKGVLAFLRYLMPYTDAAAPEARRSTGFGVWLFAAFTTLDTPLDPDTSRLAHELFRTTCRHLRTLAVWKGVSGEARDALLGRFASRAKGVRGGYKQLEDVTREDVLALYTVAVVLARFFRQNQDSFMPL